MKKLYVIGIIALMLTGIVIATTLYNTKQEALSYKATRVAEIETELSNIKNADITYLSDGICYQKINSNDTYCRVQYAVGEVDDIDMDSQSLTYPEGASATEIDEMIRAREVEMLQRDFNNERISWVDESLKDRKIDLVKK